MLTVRRAEQRGVGKTNWLDSRHTFSFADYYDPEQSGFSDLLVINDDRLQPKGGFGAHPHEDMEIFSYVLDGALEHMDSAGGEFVSRRGDIQMMSAGTGVRHSEFNASPDELLHFLQIWIVPDRKGVKPRYQQKHFRDGDKRGKFLLVISPGGEEGVLPIYQDARVYAGLFDKGESATHEFAGERYAYVYVARGKVNVNGTTLYEGDGARVRDERTLTFDNGDGAEALLFDLRPIELPDF